MIYLFVFNYFCFRVHYLLTSAQACVLLLTEGNFFGLVLFPLMGYNFSVITFGRSRL